MSDVVLKFNFGNLNSKVEHKVLLAEIKIFPDKLTKDAKYRNTVAVSPTKF